MDIEKWKELEEIKRRAKIIELFPEDEGKEQLQKAISEETEREKQLINEYKKRYLVEHKIFPPLIPFPPVTYISMSIPPNSNAVITQQFVQEGMTAYIESIAVIIPEKSCAFEIQFDNSVFLEGRIRHQIGTLAQPWQFSKPMNIDSNFKISGYNSDVDRAHCFQVLILGTTCENPRTFCKRYDIEL